MDAGELMEALESLSPVDVDREIQELQARIGRLKKLRSMIGSDAKPAGNRGGNRKPASPPLPVATDSGEAMPFDDEAVPRTDRVRRFLKARGPAGGNLIARATGIPMGSITAVLARTPGITRNEAGAYELTGA